MERKEHTDFAKKLNNLIDEGKTGYDLIKHINQQPSSVKEIYNGAPMSALYENMHNIVKEKLAKLKIKISDNLSDLPTTSLTNIDFFYTFLHHIIKGDIPVS